ncbi:hypothetical protein Aab01nite_81870 [Paractinoplanes abujensis]|uniref:Spore coat protein CotH n=1 Tax=Paractinoplanes abujensis TaxID=882441 RepID=A0A7W7CU86_9ACTN|nr:hypothetical protein [Actinoplanes abujensis]MBB4693393.1 spore coat protein CotH [Actinoplanes abujensis]GID24597.1 hypothetical protein Aab01nite_81870 [Actinoplanes abujensis]
MPAGGQGFPGGGRGGPRGMGGNKLKERFLGSTAFKTRYEDAYRDMYQKIYGNAAALNALESALKVLATVDGYDEQATSSEADRLRTLLQQRSAYLATRDVTRTS